MHTNMNPRVKGIWMADLRKNPPQIRNRLTTDAGDCCLGRLCKIAVAEGVIPPPTPSEYGEVDEHGNPVYVYLGVNGIAVDDTDHGVAVLPVAVARWAGLWEVDSNTGERYPNVAGSYDTPVGQSTSLASLNDDGVSMSAIADVIEELF